MPSSSASSAVGGPPRQTGGGRRSAGGYRDEAEREREERDRGDPPIAPSAASASAVAGGQPTAAAVPDVAPSGRQASAGAAPSNAAGDAAAAGSGSGGGSASASAGGSRQVVAASPAGAPGEVPMNNYTFFVRYTYSNECALLAYNFHELVTRLGIFEQFTYRHDHRLISVTLAYIFYRYQVHHCDMALDLAVTLVYLEDVRPNEVPELQEHNRDAFNLICYLAFLAHAFNADRTIRLSDWYKEIGWRSFRSCQQLNGYVFFLFSKVRRYRLRVSETRVKRYIQKLCSVPSHLNSEGSGGSAATSAPAPA